VLGLGFKVTGSGFGSGFGLYDLRFRVTNFEFISLQGLDFRVEGLGLRV